MRLKSLLSSDYEPFYPEPKFWFRRPYNQIGLHMRLWKIGAAFHFGAGVYCNGRKWIVFWHDPLEFTDYEKVIGVN